MKKLIYTFALLTTLSAWAEETPYRFYMLRAETVLEECDSKGDTVYGVKTAPQYSKFTIVNTTEDHFIIRFWKWDTTGYAEVKRIAPENRNAKQRATAEEIQKYDSLNAVPRATRRELEVLRYFRIKREDIDYYAIKLVEKWSLTAGAFVLPFKIRPQFGGDFSSDLTLSNVGGVRLNSPTGAWSLALVTGIGLTKITLDSASTRGTIKKSTDRSGVSFPIGLLLQHKQVQIGLVAGWDRLARSQKDGWIYQGKPWISVGIGFAIYTEGGAAKKEGEQ